MRIRLLLGLFILLPLLASAQTNTITGTLRDAASGQPLPFANVLLFRTGADSSLVKGAPTGDDGTFRLESINAGTYSLRASVVGYKALRRSVTMNGADVALGELRLATNARQLGEVQVTAEKATVQEDLNKRVINVSKDLTSVAGTAVDVLQNVPSVTVDQAGTISMRGAENVQVLIDGKQSTLGSAAALSQIPASRIDRIEVVTNPSARYDADGAGGIINIILKKETQAGANGTAAVNVGTGEKYNATLALNYRRGAFNWFGSYDFRQERRWGENELDQNTTSERGTIRAEQRGTNVNTTTNHLAKIGLDWTPTPRTTITLAAQPRYSENEQNDVIRTRRFFAATGENAGSFGRTNSSGGWNRGADFSLDFRQTFPKAPKAEASSPHPPASASSPSEGGGLKPTGTASGSPSPSEKGPGGEDAAKKGARPGGPAAAAPELTGSLLYTPSRNPTYLDARQLFDTDVTYGGLPVDWGRRQNTDLLFQVFAGRLDLLLPATKLGRVETGFKSTGRWGTLDNRFAQRDPATDAYVFDPISSNRFAYKEWVQAGYVTVQRPFGTGWTAQAGLRGEYTYTRGTQLTLDTAFTRRYFNLFPSATLAKEISPSHRVQVSYARRINRPDAQSINPALDVSDPLNQRRGNLGLYPEYLHALEAGHQWFVGRATVSTTVFWRRTLNQVQRYRQIDTAGVATVSFLNLGSNTTRGVELSVTTPLAPWLRLSANGSIFRQSLTGRLPGNAVSQRGWVSTARVNLNASPTKRTDVQLSGNYRGPAVTAQGQRLVIWFVEAGVSQKIFGDRGTVSLRVSDIFDTQEFRVTASGKGFDSRLRFKRESRIGWVGLTWRIGRDEATGQPRRRRGPADNEGGQTGGGEG